MVAAILQFLRWRDLGIMDMGGMIEEVDSVDHHRHMDETEDKVIPCKCFGVEFVCLTGCFGNTYVPFL